MNEVNEFLQESNFIEGVYDDDSLNDAILAWGFMLATVNHLDTKTILKCHKILMQRQRNLYATEIGHFRLVNVRVGSRVCPAPNEVPAMIDTWLGIVNRKYDDPLKSEDQIMDDHVAFEKIHPFVDGNGRVGRILLNWERIRNDHGILVIKESERQEYYKLFSAGERT